MKETVIVKPMTKDSKYVLIIELIGEIRFSFYGSIKKMLKENDLSQYEDIKIMSVDAFLTKEQMRKLDRNEKIETMAKLLFGNLTDFKDEEIRGLAKELDNIMKLSNKDLEKTNKQIYKMLDYSMERVSDIANDTKNIDLKEIVDVKKKNK